MAHFFPHERKNSRFHHQIQQGSGSAPILKNEVFVGNLSYFCDESDLFTLFDSYAEVITCRVMRNSNNPENINRSLLFGFVTLSSVHEAKEMSKLLTGMLFMGRKLRVDVCFANYDPSINQHANQSPAGIQVHVHIESAFPDAQSLRYPTEVLLTKIFFKFGTVVDASVKEYTTQPMYQKGYGFVTFESLEDASTVPPSFEAYGIQFQCSLTHKDNPRNYVHQHHRQQFPQHQQPWVNPVNRVSNTQFHDFTPSQFSLDGGLDASQGLGTSFDNLYDANKRY